jgi:hypothetical protein
MLHGIGTGNMIAADVLTVCVDIHPAVVSKLSDRGSAQSQGIVTDVGAFLSVLARAARRHGQGLSGGSRPVNGPLGCSSSQRHAGLTESVRAPMSMGASW